MSATEIPVEQQTFTYDEVRVILDLSRAIHRALGPNPTPARRRDMRLFLEAAKDAWAPLPK